MNHAAPANLSLPLADIDETLAAASNSRQAEITRRIANLFASRSADFSPEQVQLFGEVLERLIDKIETRVLAELGEQFGTIPNAPSAIIQRLARRDEIAVARPVLANSSQLSEDDLVELSETKSQAHLLAISERRTIPERVTDVLVRRGDNDVTRSMAANLGARFSETGFDLLSSRAGSDELIAERMAQRADVPPHLFGRILVQASDAVRCRILAAAPAELHADLGSILEKISGELADEAPLARDYGTATRRVLLAYPDGCITEEDLLQMVWNGQHEDVVAALSIVSAVAVDTVDRLMSDRRIEPIQFLCKGLGLGWTSARALLQLGPCKDGPAELLAAAHDDFGRIPLAAAERMLNFWRTRETLASYNLAN